MADTPAAALAGIPLERWKHAADAATPGPWEAHSHLRQYSIWHDELDQPLAREVRVWDDAVFISAARTAMPRLVAAAEAVLARHGPGRITILGKLCERHESHRFFSITRTEAAGVEACPDCPASVYVSCAGCGPQVRLDSCPDRAAITSALTGEERSDGK